MPWQFYVAVYICIGAAWLAWMRLFAPAFWRLVLWSMYTAAMKGGWSGHRRVRAWEALTHVASVLFWPFDLHGFLSPDWRSKRCLLPGESVPDLELPDER